MILFEKRIALYVITYSSAIYLIVTSLKAFCYLQIDIETEIRELISYDEYLRPTTETISSYAIQHSRKRVLVLMNGQMRGGEIAWNSLQKYVLDYYDADLAYIGPPLNRSGVEKNVVKRMKMLWEYEDPEDWATYFVRPKHRETDLLTLRSICLFREIHTSDQFLGGVKLNNTCRHPGSAGMLLAYRRLALEKVIENDLNSKYDWIIYTRTDYLYLCHPPRLDALMGNFIYIPRGEEYGGITDRLHYIPGKLISKALNITNNILSDPFSWLFPLREGANLEQLLATYYAAEKILFRKFRHVAFTVRTEEDPSSWSLGFKHSILQKFRLSPKYKKEIINAVKTCSVVQCKLTQD